MQTVAEGGELAQPALGWIGAGRMGAAMAERLLRAGHQLSVFNRTRSKTDPLVAQGAKAVDSIADLGDRDVVFVTVASSDDLLAVLSGEGGLLGAAQLPKIVVDCSTVSEEASAKARALAAAQGVAFLAAPVSGNPKVARAGRLTMVVSGPRPVFDEVEPQLRIVAGEVVYVGEGDVSRLVKLCHNLLLGVVIQSLAEITVLAQRGGVQRADFLAFLNSSVLGSLFTQYKTPALVNLDFEPTFTTRLLRKDFDLGLGAARALEVPMPVAGLVHQLLGAGIGKGIGDVDFAALVELVARDAGITLESEGVQVPDGLDPEGPGARATGDPVTDGG
jgi:3-hydroxyisobutyrate dehydrogenase-like beta-hydroxyacid dehydrogenase